MSIQIAIEHSAEMSHRLPFMKGRCENLHGHSWSFKFFILADVDENGISVDYGEVKSIVRGFIDEYWDHGTALGIDDTLLPHFDADPHHKKTYVFGLKGGVAEHYPWPTVEAFAHVAAMHIQAELDDHFHDEKIVIVDRVEVRETAVNFGIWQRDS